MVRLREEYDSLKADLVAEVSAVDDRIIRPAMDAREYLQPLKKVIKKREDKKVCIEKSVLPGYRVLRANWSI